MSKKEASTVWTFGNLTAAEGIRDEMFTDCPAPTEANRKKWTHVVFLRVPILKPEQPRHKVQKTLDRIAVGGIRVTYEGAYLVFRTNRGVRTLSSALRYADTCAREYQKYLTNAERAKPVVIDRRDSSDIGALAPRKRGRKPQMVRRPKHLRTLTG